MIQFKLIMENKKNKIQIKNQNKILNIIDKKNKKKQKRQNIIFKLEK